MPINIIERAMVPYNSSDTRLFNKNQYSLFVPIAGVNKPGMAGYNPEYFAVQDGIVTFSQPFVATLDGLETNVTNLIADIGEYQAPPVDGEHGTYTIKEFLWYLNARLNIVATDANKLANYTYGNGLLDDIVVDADAQTITFKYFKNEEPKSIVISFDEFNAQLLSDLRELQTYKNSLVTALSDGSLADEMYVVANPDGVGYEKLSTVLAEHRMLTNNVSALFGISVGENGVVENADKNVLQRLRELETLIANGGILQDVKFNQDTYKLQLTFVIADGSNPSLGEDDDSEPDVIRTVEVDLSKLVDPDELAAAIANLNVQNGSGVNSTAQRGNVASGESSASFGKDNAAHGYCAFAEGSTTEAMGSYSHTEGYKTTAQYNASHAEGCETNVSYQYGHAEGYQTSASSQAAHAEGYNTTASGWISHAEGNTTTASGTNAHSEGSNTIARGTDSHAEGRLTVANGEHSHAAGLGTVANGLAQTVVGKYNSLNQSALFVVGNGTSESARSNAFAVFEDGSLSVGGVTATPEQLGKLQDIDTKLDKVTTTGNDRAYCISTAGNQMTYDVIAYAYDANSICRRTSSGALYVATPTKDNHAATKAYVDNAVASASGSKYVLREYRYQSLPSTFRSQYLSTGRVANSENGPEPRDFGFDALRGLAYYDDVSGEHTKECTWDQFYNLVTQGSITLPDGSERYYTDGVAYMTSPVFVQNETVDPDYEWVSGLTYLKRYYVFSYLVVNGIYAEGDMIDYSVFIVEEK